MMRSHHCIYVLLSRCHLMQVFFVVIVVFRAMAARRSLLVPQAGKMGGGMDDAFGPSIQSTASYY